MKRILSEEEMEGDCELNSVGFFSLCFVFCCHKNCVHFLKESISLFKI